MGWIRDYAGQRRASADAARAIGLREGDEVAIGGRAYAITRISDDGVMGETQAESGYFIAGERLQLDMRLPGWAALPLRGEPDRYGSKASLRGTLVRLVRLMAGILDAAPGRDDHEYEELADIVRNMRGAATLPRGELAEALSSANKAHLAVAAATTPDGLTVILGDLRAATVPLSAFRPNGAASPDFGRLGLADCGNTIRLGEYEASARVAWDATREAGEGRAEGGGGQAEGDGGPRRAKAPPAETEPVRTAARPGGKPPTWENTLNSRLAGGLWNLDAFLETALKAGYPYVEWNDMVYPTAGFNLNGSIMPARCLDQAQGSAPET